MNKRLFSIFFIFVFFLLTQTIALADTYMKQVKSSDAYTVMGQTIPEKTETTETWIGEKASRVNLPDGTSTLLVFAEQKAYALKHADRTYAEMPMSMDQMMDEVEEDIDTEDEEDMAASRAMRDMAGGMMSQIKISVRDTGEKGKTGKWNARKYEMITEMGSMGKSVDEVWATEELKVDMKSYWKARSIMQAQQPGFDKIMKEMEKIKGVIVKTISRATAMGTEIKTTEELVDFSSKPAPADTFKIPSDYKKVSFVGRY
ncbi:MAG: DUF4412 domain-containing protein [Deltaproteobacteria bacterium]|nr:DUF4412 domain-containing protein [Deltaproteobacteria bacterium]